MNPVQRLALLRNILTASEIERDAIIKAKQTHIDALRQLLDQAMNNGTSAEVAVVVESAQN